MTGILSGVDQRTQLAGHNRLEVLVFTLNGGQKFGLNVFKIQEVIQRPELTKIPGSNDVICGVAHLRGKDIPVMDMSMAIGETPLQDKDNTFVVITEFNRTVQGFLVGGVNIYWKDVSAPPEGTAAGSYLTAIAEIDEDYVLIIDVEKILSEILGEADGVTKENIDQRLEKGGHVLVVDDSLVAREQVKRVLDDLGLDCTFAVDGQDGLRQLKKWVADGIDVPSFLTMVISDVEMPKMDGYTLTTAIRKMPELEGLYVMLHTSLSGVFNETMIQRVGADVFMAKYKPNELAIAIQKRMKSLQGVKG